MCEPSQDVISVRERASMCDVFDCLFNFTNAKMIPEDNNIQKMLEALLKQRFLCKLCAMNVVFVRVFAVTEPTPWGEKSH